MRSGIPGVAGDYEKLSVGPRTETTILQVESVCLDCDVERAMGGIRDSGYRTRWQTTWIPEVGCRLMTHPARG
jgi:hypothetical protein